MNKFLKKLMALGLSVGMFAGIGLGFVGCDIGKTNVPDTPIVDQNKDKEPDKDKDPDKDKEPDNQDTPPVTEKKTLEQAAKEFDAFIQKCVVGKNFTYEQQYSLNNMTVEFAGDKMKMGDENGVIYLAEENGEQFLITLEDDNAWHKDFADEKLSIDSMLSSLSETFGNITWTAYDEKSNLLIREVSIAQGVPLKSKMEANFDQNDMNIKMEAGKTKAEVKLHKVGTTTVTLPEKVIDDTAEDQYIYTVDENGETVWNVKAIKEVLEPWLKNEGEGNQYGKDMFASSSKNGTAVTKEVLYINPSKDKIAFGLILDVDGQLCFGESYFYDSAFYASLKNKETMTKKEFNEYLMQLNQRRLGTSMTYLNVEYTTYDEDYGAAHKQEFETLTKNVFEKYHKEKTADDPDYNDAQVLFAAKGFASDMHLGSDGYGKEFSLYYLLERKDGTIELIETRLRGLTSGLGYLENVLQNQEGKWSFEYPEKVVQLSEISGENEDLYSSSIITIGETGEEKQI